ncbi:MAG: class I SAM-dependent methyltransferase [Candidatus Nanoarchaeia archaeon]|nr:class I SAM-dependent methyltransferase [Candidatus Nanoarchaeia archaeon]MDD5740991.1 class I SAM-dependent methyltransferase [Candidatus Nanoarchaeia archaeon]
MSIYDAGWLAKFLDSKNQPQEIKDYLREENKLLLEKIKKGTSLVDFGCGYGRHLELLAERLSYGLGIDINDKAVEQARRNLSKYNHIELRVADCRDLCLRQTFDYAISMNNTIGNIEEKEKVIAEMKKAVFPDGRCILGLYNINSIEPRVLWYEKTGLKIKKVTEDYIETDKGFRSYHFTKEEIIRLTGRCDILSIAEIGYFGFF